MSQSEITFVLLSISIWTLNWALRPNLQSNWHYFESHNPTFLVRASFWWSRSLCLVYFVEILLIFLFFDIHHTCFDVNFMMDFFTNIGLSVYASKGFSSFRITEMIQFLSSVRVCVCEHLNRCKTSYWSYSMQGGTEGP